MSLTRRNFLSRVGLAGGYGAAFLSMQGLGFMEAKASPTMHIDALPGSGKNTRVVVLGGGIAGMVAAYELRALGYECMVLEARERPGGRNWTVRGGDTVRLTDGSVQTCTWQKGHYQDFGPARLPSTHSNILRYCRTLGVDLQVEVNMTRSALLQNDDALGGRPQVMRQVENDTRGHVSELLAKSIHQGALDQQLTAEDRDRMLSFLRLYGPLDKADQYAGSERAGYATLPGAGRQVATISTPIDMHSLLDAAFWRGILIDEVFDQQATMFQPMGGMDRIAYAFAGSLGKIVHYNAQVSGLHKTANGVRVTYSEAGTEKQTEAAFCICTLPLNLLRSIPNDLSAPYKKVLEECTYAGSYKIAWESRRFWEQEYNIYGGLEFLTTGCSPIWFPSSGMLTERGVLVSGYADETTMPFGKLSLAEKLAESRKSVEKLHPGHGKELEKPIYVGWQRVPHNEGSWIRAYTRQDGESFAGTEAAGLKTNPGYDTLIEPDGPIVFAGDHISHLVAWQEGAIVSALRAVGQVSERVKSGKLAGQW